MLGLITTVTLKILAVYQQAYLVFVLGTGVN